MWRFIRQIDQQRTRQRQKKRAFKEFKNSENPGVSEITINFFKGSKKTCCGRSDKSVGKYVRQIHIKIGSKITVLNYHCTIKEKFMEQWGLHC